MFKIIVDSPTFLTGRLAVELSHLIGFESVAMDFPILKGKTDVLECGGLTNNFLFCSERVSSPYTSQNKKPSASPLTVCALECEGLTNDFPASINTPTATYFFISESPGDFRVKKSGNIVDITIGDQSQILAIWRYCADHFAELSGREQCAENISAEGFTAATDSPHPIDPFDKRHRKGLESLFDKDFILKDEDLDLLPDLLTAKIVLSENLDFYQLSAACNLAARLGMETTVALFPITAKESESTGNRFVFKPGSVCSLKFENDGDALVFEVSGEGAELENFTSVICTQFPIQNQGRRWVDILEEMAESFAMKNLDGELSWLEAFGQAQNVQNTAYFSPKVHHLRDEVKNHFSNTQFVGFKDIRQVEQRAYDLPWEVDVCQRLLDDSVWSKAKPGDEVVIRAVLSEDKAVRAQLMRQWEEKGARVQVICAYKQGFSWVEDIILPQLSDLEVDEVEIAFKAFLRPGTTIWKEEDGAMPSYGDLDTSDGGRWYDQPIRYLQELYPIDDVLALALGIDRSKIRFTEYKGSEDITYNITVFSSGKQVLMDTYTAYNVERNYIDLYPNLGKVHPGTGHVTAWINNEIVLDERVKTDVEAVWEAFQEDVLPWVRAHSLEKTGGKLTSADQPFFAQLHIELGLSEPDERLKIREDMISSLNALHEDIYFVGTDFFKVHGLENGGEALDAPGLILPDIRKRLGKPSMTVTLLDQKASEPYIEVCGNVLRPDYAQTGLSLIISEIGFEDGLLVPLIEVRGPDEAISAAKAYASLLNKGFLGISERLQNLKRLGFKLCWDKAEPEICFIKIPTLPSIKKDLDIRSIDISEKELIGYEQYLRIIEQLKHVPGIDVYPIAESYLGRDIYAIELLPSWNGYVSRTKRLTKGPSTIINCRHHANEVSATNAAFILVRELLADEQYIGIADEMCIVIAPFENADGAAIHYELQKHSPWWKLHIARYNAVGKEFYYEHFKDETIHVEAHGFTRLWRRWLPDAVLDNHGVPSHEWEQPFSGYTAPSFKGFWLPRSLLYGCYWSVQGEAYADNIHLAKRMEANIAAACAKDAEISSWNNDWQDRFEKYANAWMPRLFPADYFENMINYWVPFDYDAVHRYPSIRYPWITTVAYTAEVADETAQGDYLYLCARTHVLHNLTTLDILRKGHSFYRREINAHNAGAMSSNIRLRPLCPQVSAD
ncbi:MAG: M14 family metallopeptidase [Oscillospiraceae bacterium]|nr:M14 family metallopeptidase [Oscillospiraceae bacterium]